MLWSNELKFDGGDRIVTIEVLSLLPSALEVDAIIGVIDATPGIQITDMLHWVPGKADAQGFASTSELVPHESVTSVYTVRLGDSATRYDTRTRTKNT